MFKNSFPVLVILLSGIAVFAQVKSYESPAKNFRALIVPVGEKVCESCESRIEIRTFSGKLLRRRSFASPDHNHGAGVDHAEWSADGRFFVFNTTSSGGHQPWHVATYFYSVRSNKLYSLDALVGPVTSDFTLLGRDTVLITRLRTNVGEKKPVNIRLNNWR